MKRNTPPGEDQTVWPPPPTQGPPTVAAAPTPGLSRRRVFGQIVGRMTLMGLTFGAVCGAAFGGALAWGFGLMIGLFYGGVAGLFLGIIEGLVLAAVTCLKFFPLLSADGYRRALGMFTLVLTLVGASLLSGTLFGGWGSGQGQWSVNWFEIVPVSIATIAAWAASQRIARWYATASGKQ